MAYYNTTNIKGKPLKVAKQKAKGQKDEILETFKGYKHLGLNRIFTPSQIWELLYKDNGNVPLTSVRRAMSDLTYKDLELIKTDKKQIGIYGRPEHFYRLTK